MIKRIVGLLTVILGLCAWASPLRAGLVDGEIISVGIGGTPSAPWGRYREGCWIPVHIRLTNRTVSQVSVRVAVEQNDLDGDSVQNLSQPIIIEPNINGRDMWFYYWPRPDDEPDRDGVPAMQILDDKARTVVGKITPPGKWLRGEGSETTPAPVPPWIRKPDTYSYAYAQSQRNIIVLGPKHIGLAHYLGSIGGVMGNEVKFIDAPAELPDRAIGLDGVDLIVWQADEVHPTDVPAGFQLKAIQDWVRAGGHLIITAGRSQDLKAVNFGAGFLPMEVTGSQEKDAATLFQGPPPAGASGLFLTHSFDGLKISQLVGTPATDAAIPEISGDPQLAGLVVRHNVGAGAVTLITVSLGDVDLPNNDPRKLMKAEEWLHAWQELMRWPGRALTYVQVQQMRKAQPELKWTPEVISLDEAVAGHIDFDNQTTVRLLMAALFLGLYWLAAGPVGAGVLRYYKISHWGWWIFGGTVLAASGLAILVVSSFKLEQIDIKHQTWVVGTANAPGDVAIDAYYGVFAPIEGQVQLSLPDTPGLAYLAPFNAPIDVVQSYADPQQYVIDDAGVLSLKVPFRSTLKKMQARWTGPTKMTLQATGLKVVRTNTIDDNNKGSVPTVSGRIVNHTGYTLHDIEVIIPGDGKANLAAGTPDAIVDIDQLRDGETADLTDVKSRRLGAFPNNPNALSNYVSIVSRRFADDHHMLGHGGGFAIPGDADAATERYPADFLGVLLEQRTAQSINMDERFEFDQGLTRLADRGKNLQWKAALIIAHAGTEQSGVPSPIPMTVAGREVRGSGQIMFTWIVNP